MITGYIYCVTNIVNNMKYIGKTVRSIDCRWQQHINDSIRGSTFYLHSSMRKYGIDKFNISILETRNFSNKNESNKILAEREMAWIDKLNTFSPNGYNLTKGGEGIAGFKVSDHTKKLISEKNRLMVGKKNSRFGKHLSIETKMKLAESIRGSKHHMYGKHLPEKHRMKISESMKNIVFTKEHRNNLSKAMKGKRSGENNHRYGTHHTIETKLKISEAQKGAKHHMYGKRLSKIHRINISEGLKRRYRSKMISNDHII